MTEIVLEGPGKNALGTGLMERAIAAIRAAGDAPVLVRGSGDAFSAGLDLREVVSLDVAGMEAFLGRMGELFDLLFHHPAPTVACVNGHAIAGGCILAVACDHRVATSDPRARIGLNEVALGLRFPPGVLAIVRYRVPSLEPVILGAALHPPADALRLGLVDELADDPLPVARQRLAALAMHPRAAYSHAKRELRAAVGRPDPERTRAYLAEVLPAWTSDEIKALIRAFLDRKR